MAQVFIEIEGPIMENLARVTITDREDEETLHVDFADVERARDAGGVDAVLDLISENVARGGYDILKAAFVNETPVTLDGEPVTKEQIAGSFNFAASVPSV